MKKYLHYIKKYVENFGFVNRVVWLTLKYNFMIIIYSNKKLMKYIIKRNTNFMLINSKTYSKHIFCEFNEIDRIVALLPFKGSCLIKSLVKEEYFSNKGIHFKIELGLNKSDCELLPHAWLSLQ